MRKPIRFSYLLMLLMLFAPLAYSQAGKVTGKTIDNVTGEPLPFVNIVVEGTTLGAASNIDGDYVILNVPPGVYSLKASAIGFNSVTVQNIQVATGLTTNLDFRLGEQTFQIQQEIVIVATRPLVQKDLTATTSIVGEDLINELPVTDLGDILQLQAGITIGSGGDLHMRGGRSGQIAYQIDGVVVTDAYDGSSVIDVGTSSVKELQVISGAFNAEYGQAMSGIVNIVTKDGDNKYTGSVSSYVGDYVSNRNDVFWNIDDLNPVAIRNVEASLSGPILKDKFYFFSNFRYYENTGYFFGKQTFLTSDVSRENTDNQTFFIADANDPTFAAKDPGGSGEYKAMNDNFRLFGQAKLTYVVLPGMSVRYSYIYDYQKYHDYNSDRRLTPDNNLDRFRSGISNTLSLNHAISAYSFYNLNLSYFFKDYRHYLFEDIYTGDPNHPTNYIDNRLKQNPPYSFDIGGTDNNRYVRNTGTINAKLDWETQFTKEINIKFGAETKFHRIFEENINLIPMTDANGAEVAPFNVTIPGLTSNEHSMYEKKPSEFSGYVQSKFEAFNLIFNIGVRMDMFNPDGQVLADPTDPNIYNPVKPGNKFTDLNNNGIYEPESGETWKTVDDRRSYWYKDATMKTQISPRIGLAFPITDRGVIHFSYGHFFQLPGYNYLYSNPEFELADASGNVGLIGNADLEPQKTIKGEIGLQQALSDDMAIDITLFFEDFRNLTGTQNEDIAIFGTQSTYSKYANSDFGFSKGFIIKFEKRFSEGLAVNLDYTFSVTRGNSSNPADARNAILGGAAPETYIAPLDWDQAHTLNISVAYSVPQDFGLSIIGNFYSGQPYTPQVNKNTRVTQNAFPRNSSYKPSIFNIDLRAFKDFAVSDAITVTLMLRIFNLLDLENPRGVYGDTGDPRFTFGLLEARNINPTLYYNTLDELFTNPGFYSEPRRIEFGATINF